MSNRKVTPTGYMLIAVHIILIGFFTVHSAMAQTALSTVSKESPKPEEAAKKPVIPTGPADEYDRGRSEGQDAHGQQEHGAASGRPVGDLRHRTPRRA